MKKETACSGTKLNRSSRIGQLERGISFIRRCAWRISGATWLVAKDAVSTFAITLSASIAILRASTG